MAAFSQHSTVLIVLAFAISQLGPQSVQGVFWTIPPLFLGGTAAAAGIAFINSIGNLGGFFGPTVMGELRKRTDGYTTGLLVIAAGLTLQAILVATLRLAKPAPKAAPRGCLAATAK